AQICLVGATGSKRRFIWNNYEWREAATVHFACVVFRFYNYLAVAFNKLPSSRKQVRGPARQYVCARRDYDTIGRTKVTLLERARCVTGRNCAGNRRKCRAVRRCFLPLIGRA